MKTYKEPWKNEYVAARYNWYVNNRPLAVAADLVPLPALPDVRKANGLTKFVIGMIEGWGGYANRISSAGRMINKGVSKIYIPGTTKKGTADIHAIIKGIHYSIEIKIGNDVMSKFQHAEAERITKAGGNYYVIKTAEQFLFIFADKLKPTT